MSGVETVLLYVLGIAMFLLPLVLVPTLFAGLYLQVRDVFGPR